MFDLGVDIAVTPDILIEDSQLASSKMQTIAHRTFDTRVQFEPTPQLTKRVKKIH